MITRRRLMQGMGALGIAGITSSTQRGNAAQATVGDKPAKLLLIMMNGGYAPFQTSAASFLNNTEGQMHFGVKNNPIDARGELTFDVSTWGQLPEKALSSMACIGSIGASNHNSAKHFWEGAEGGLPQALAAAMGGSSAIKAAKVQDVTGAPSGSVGGVSLETVKDMTSGLEALTGAGQLITQEDRPIMGAIVNETHRRFVDLAAANPDNLSSLVDGYKNLVTSMTVPAASVDGPTIASAYAANGTYSLNEKLATAEALLRSGVNVVCVGEGSGTYWDTHDDNDGSRSREFFGLMVQPLGTFLDRMLGREDMNLTVVFVSEHSRIPLINNHGPHLSTIVFSDNVVPGASTGITDNGGLVPNAEQKPITAWKSAIGALVGLGSAENPNPFGNAWMGVHDSVIQTVA